MPTDIRPLAPSPLLVACLCAQWCATCREYRAAFDSLARDSGEGFRFLWVDIEDEAERVDPIEVENFPTLLIARGSEPLFFGPLTPQRDTLSRLLQVHADPLAAGPSRPVSTSEELRALALRLMAAGGG